VPGWRRSACWPAIQGANGSSRTPPLRRSQALHPPDVMVTGFCPYPRKQTPPRPRPAGPIARRRRGPLFLWLVWYRPSRPQQLRHKPMGPFALGNPPGGQPPRESPQSGLSSLVGNENQLARRSAVSRKHVGTSFPGDKLTGDFGNEPDATSISDPGLFRLLAGNLSPDAFRLCNQI